MNRNLIELNKLGELSTFLQLSMNITNHIYDIQWKKEDTESLQMSQHNTTKPQQIRDTGGMSFMSAVHIINNMHIHPTLCQSTLETMTIP